jgi:hypothetical protein
MRDPLARVVAIATPQNQPLRGRAQVRNAAGGYVFEKSLWTRLEDFLILGTTGGTYYATEDKLTTTNVGWLIDAIAEDGPRVVALVADISTARPPRAPKPRACRNRRPRDEAGRESCLPEGRSNDRSPGHVLRLLEEHGRQASRRSWHVAGDRPGDAVRVRVLVRC